MRRRAGFTLVEMLVSVALVLFIMVILTEAFGKGLESFRTLKAIGDMESRLRAAADILRRDLNADHFEGKRRLSDPNTRWNAMGVPREGFFNIQQNFVPGSLEPEGEDSDRLTFQRQLDMMYFTVKLRGNNRSEFFYANLAPPLASTDGPSPLLNPAVRSTFFDQPSDARFQDTPNSYAGQWAEVLYVPRDSGTKTPRGDTLYTLFRGQLVLVADNSRLNWPPGVPPFTPITYSTNALDQHKEMSCYQLNNILYFNNPSDVATLGTVTTAGRTFLGLTASNASRRLDRWPLMPALSDVLSFDVDYLRQDSDITVVNGTMDTGTSRGNPILAIRITIRVWDQKTRQTRQITLLQDM